MQKHWVGWCSLCKYRFKDCFLFWCLLKCGNQHRKKKRMTWATRVCGAWGSTVEAADPSLPSNSAALKRRPLYANAHQLPSSEQSTGLTFNYKINMDFLINTWSVSVYRNGALQSPRARTELRPFFCQSQHIKNLLCSEKKKKKKKNWPSQPHGVNQ